MKYTNINAEVFKEMLLSGVYELDRNKDLLNSLNVFPVPDGDTGTNMGATMQSTAAEINNQTNISITSIADAASMGSLMGARGNSGVILSQLLRGIAKGLKGKKTLTTRDFAQALKEGVNTAYKAVMKPVEGTILTVSRETADKAIEISRHEDDFEIFFIKIHEEAIISLNKTPDLLPALKQAGVVDAGGKGFEIILLGMLKRLQNGYIVESTKQTSVPDKTIEYANVDTSHIKFGYCTEFFIKSDASNCNILKEKLANLGDSLIVVGMDSTIKVHIHTNDLGTIFNEALSLGELTHIKVDNMKEQHRHVLIDSAEEPMKVEEPVEEKEYGIITVAIGDGITSVFKDLGVDVVIEGGQTMNPSTQDILDAIKSIAAKTIYVLPNNSNIIMAAEQAKELSNKNIIVIPTKSIPQGVTAAITFNPDYTCDENTKEMLAAIKNVKTGEITFAVRDTTYNDIEVKEGNKIALLNRKLINSGKDLDVITKELLDTMICDDNEIITVFYGNNLKESDVKNINLYLNEKYSDKDISIINGGQPLYYYIISVE